MTQRTGCCCNYCGRSFKRQALDRHFLCAECQKLPGVRGYRDPKQRGLEQDWSREYSKMTATQTERQMVCDDPKPAAAANAGTATAATAAPPAAFIKYQALVLARADLTFADKLVFRALVDHADHKTGANCAPKLEDVAARYGQPTDWARRHTRKLTKSGVIEAHPLQSQRGCWAQNLYRFIGHGFEGPKDASKLKWLSLSPTPRPQGDRWVAGRSKQKKKKVL